MIKQDNRKAIYCLYQEGMGVRELSRRFNISTTTVMGIIEQKGKDSELQRSDKVEIDPELLRGLYKDCNGYVERIHEKLYEEKGIDIGYSTLTRLIREQEIGISKNQRCGQVPDEPGAEFQHDTTVYRLKFGVKQVKVVASIIYFRYSKVRYLKFYRSFNRFKMKCFFHEALTFFGYAAKVCIIDNTNLARLHGTGKNAVISPEMIQFAKQYGFEFMCHEIGHANRKAGNEKSFHTVETNFLPGRTFESLEDINQQAFLWATVKMVNRPVAKTSLIPAKAFEFEQSYLVKLSPYISPPYVAHERTTDQYGYASFNANFYWVPGTKRYDITVVEYGDHVKIYRQRELLGEYELPLDCVKNEKIFPKGQSKPKHQPIYRKKPTAHEEKILRSASDKIDRYLDFAIKPDDPKKHRFIRQLYGLYQKIALAIFIKAVERAHQYRITDIETIERIAILKMRDGNYEVPFVQINQEFEKRESYLEGRFTDEVDLSIYDKIMEKKDG